MISNAQVSEIEFYYFLFFIALILLISAIRTIRGRKYRTRSVLFRPILYLIIGLAILSDNFPFLTLVLLAIVAGFLVGIKYGGGVTFFFRDGILYYKRPILLYVVWLSLFVTRILFEFYYLNNSYGILIVDNLLMFSSGLLIGEAYHIITKARTISRTT